jgi:hypothetical protein
MENNTINPTNEVKLPAMAATNKVQTGKWGWIKEIFGVLATGAFWKYVLKELLMESVVALTAALAGSISTSLRRKAQPATLESFRNETSPYRSNSYSSGYQSPFERSPQPEYRPSAFSPVSSGPSEIRFPGV